MLEKGIILEIDITKNTQKETVAIKERGAQTPKTLIITTHLTPIESLIEIKKILS